MVLNSHNINKQLLALFETISGAAAKYEEAPLAAIASAVLRGRPILHLETCEAHVDFVHVRLVTRSLWMSFITS